MNLQAYQRGALPGIHAHNMRTGYLSASINPDLIGNNRLLDKTLIDDSDPGKPIVDIPIPEVQPNGRKIREDARVAASFIMTLPEELGPAQLDEWVAASMDWWNQLPGQPAYAVLHLDEPGARPHIHAIRIPMDAEGHLNYKRDFGGHAERLDEIQQSYGEALASLGVEMAPLEERQARRKARREKSDKEPDPPPKPPVKTRGELAAELKTVTKRAETAEAVVAEVAKLTEARPAAPTPKPAPDPSPVTQVEPERQRSTLNLLTGGLIGTPATPKRMFSPLMDLTPAVVPALLPATSVADQVRAWIEREETKRKTAEKQATNEKTRRKNLEKKLEETKIKVANISTTAAAWERKHNSLWEICVGFTKALARSNQIFVHLWEKEHRNTQGQLNSPWTEDLVNGMVKLVNRWVGYAQKPETYNQIEPAKDKLKPPPAPDPWSYDK